jgi:hypothetical protein
MQASCTCLSRALIGHERQRVRIHAEADHAVEDAGQRQLQGQAVAAARHLPMPLPSLVVTRLNAGGGELQQVVPLLATHF